MKSFVAFSTHKAITTNKTNIALSSRLCSTTSSSLSTSTSQNEPLSSSSTSQQTVHTGTPSPRELLYQERYHAYYHHLCQRAAHFDHTRRRPFGRARVQSETYLKLLAKKRHADERLYTAILQRRTIEDTIITVSDSKLDFIPSLPPGWSLWGGKASGASQQPKKVVKTRKQTPLGRITEAVRFISVVVPTSLLSLFGIRPLYWGILWVYSLADLRSVRKRREHLSKQLDAAMKFGEDGGESGSNKVPYYYYDVHTNTRLHPRSQTLQSVAFGSGVSGSGGPLSRSFLKETALSPALQAEINTFFHLATISESDLPHNNSIPSHLKATSNLCNDLVFSSVAAESVGVDLEEVVIPEGDEESVDALLDVLDDVAGPMGTALNMVADNSTKANDAIASEDVQQPVAASSFETPTHLATQVMEADNKGEEVTSSTILGNLKTDAAVEADLGEEDDTSNAPTSNAASSFDQYKEDALKEVLAAVAAHKKRSARLEHSVNDLNILDSNSSQCPTPNNCSPKDEDNLSSALAPVSQSGSLKEVENVTVEPSQVVGTPQQQSEPSQQDFKRQIFQLQMLWYDSTSFFPPSVTKAFYKAGSVSIENEAMKKENDSSTAAPPLSPEESALLYKLATISSNPTLNSSYGPPLFPIGYPLRLYLDVPHSHNLLANFIEGACRDISFISQKQFNLDDDTAVQRGLGAFAKLQFYFPPTNVRQQVGGGVDGDLATEAAKGAKATSNLKIPPHTHILSLLADSTNALKRCVAETMGPEVRPNSSIRASKSDKVWSPIQLIPGVPWAPIQIVPGATVPHKLGVEYSSLLKTTCVAPPTASGVVSTAGNRYSLCPTRAMGSDVPLATLRSEHFLRAQSDQQQHPKKWRWTPNERPGIPAPTYRPRTPPEATLDDIAKVVGKLSQSLRNLNLLTSNRFGQRLDDSFDKDRTFPEIKKPEGFGGSETESSEVATIATSWPLSYILSAPTQGSYPDPLNPVSPAPNFVFPHASDIYTFSTPRQQQRHQEQHAAFPLLNKIPKSVVEGAAAINTNAPPRGFTSTYAVTVVSMAIGDVANSLIGITSTLSSLIQHQLHVLKKTPTTTKIGDEKTTGDGERASISSRKGRRGRRSPQRHRRMSRVEGLYNNAEREEEYLDEANSQEVAPSSQSAKDAHALATFMTSKKNQKATKQESPSSLNSGSEIDVSTRPSNLSPHELEKLSLPHCWRSNLLLSTTLGIESALLDLQKNKRKSWSSTNDKSTPPTSKAHIVQQQQQRRRRSSSYLASPDVVDRVAKRAVETLINDRVKKASIKRLPFEEGPPTHDDTYDELYRDVKQRLGSFELKFRAASKYALNEVKK